MTDEGTHPSAIGRRDTDERLLEEAAAWQRALARDDADWDEYVEWLEADDGHREAFDAVVLADRAVEDHADRLRELLGPIWSTSDDAALRPIGLTPPATAQGRRRIVLGGMAAAAAAVAFLVARPSGPSDEADVLHRSADRVEHLSLRGGIDVDLAPRTTLVLKGGNPERMALVEGVAFFDVAHDPRRTLSIEAGGTSIRDIGTSFGVDLSPNYLLVSVAEGRVGLASSGARPLNVSAGQRYTLDRGTGRSGVAGMAPASIGSWRRGQLTYAGTPLPVVVADMARFTGRRIELDSAEAGRSFSGALTIGEGSQPVRLLADIMGVTYEERDGRIRLSAPRR